LKVVLLPNMVEFPSVSMQRYADELGRALRRVAGKEWEIEELICHHANRAARLIPGTQGEKMASRLGRFVKYPMLASRTAGDVYHVLDHSHANLTLALNGDKTIITCHDIIPLLASLKKVPIASGRLTKYTFPQRIRCMKRCRYILTVSEATKRDLCEYGGVDPAQVIVAHNGVNTTFRPDPVGDTSREERTAAIRKKHGFPEGAKVILHVGTATRYKNTPALLRALKLLLEEPSTKNEVWLLRAGAPFYEDEDALIDELGIRQRVVHAGRLPDDEALADYYRAADVFAFPSLYEGFGWPPLESLACGTPVVTSNVASLPEVVGDAGLTVDPRDPAALAAALTKLLAETGSVRRARVAKSLSQAGHFTWDNCARVALDTYQKVAAGS
jgi:glycosyltransferase involved in cell wall biosynthesis